MKLTPKQSRRHSGHILVVGAVILAVFVILLALLKPELCQFNLEGLPDFKKLRQSQPQDAQAKTGSQSTEPEPASAAQPTAQPDAQPAPQPNGKPYKMVTMEGKRYMAIQNDSGQWQLYGPIDE